MWQKAAVYTTILTILFAPMSPQVKQIMPLDLENTVLESMVVRITVACAIIALYINMPLLKALWIYRHIPGPTPMPFIGNIPCVMTGNFHENYDQWHRQYGCIFKRFLGTHCIIVLNDLSSIREVGLKKFSAFGNRSPKEYNMLGLLPDTMQFFNQYGLFASTNQYWKGIRSTYASILHSVEILHSFCPLMQSIANALVQRLSEIKYGESLDIYHALGDMSLDVVGSTVFGLEFNAVQSKTSDAARASEIIFENAGYNFSKRPYFIPAFIAPEFMCVLRWLGGLLPSTFLKDLNWAAMCLTQVSERIVDDAMSERSRSMQVGKRTLNGNGARVGEKARENLTKLFFDKHNRETGKVMSKREVSAQAFTLALAGYETTASTLACCIYLLSKHKDKEERLIQEIDALSSGDLASADQLDQCVYVDAVLKEALRMYGPAPYLERHASSTTKLKTTTIYKGTTLHLATNNVHWNPSHFPDPSSFVPERFIAGDEIYSQQNHQAFMPFGIGPRMCVAYKFAMMESKLALLQLYKSYTFSLKHEVSFQLGLTLSPSNGVHVYVHHRRKTNEEQVKVENVRQ